MILGAGGGVAAGSEAIAFSHRAITVADRAGVAPLDSAQRREVAAALERLPAPLLDRPLLIERGRDVRCNADGLPSGDGWWNRNANKIRLCDGAARDLPRQIATAVIYAFDASEAGGWSDTPAWHLLGGWRSSALSGWQLFAENTAAGAHVGTGMGAAPASPERALWSPRWDLVTFSVAALLDGPGGITCRLISHATFLRARLPLAGEACPAFDQWADLDSLEDVELVLAAPSSAMVGSMFGHLFLRLRYRGPSPDLDSNGEVPAEAGRTVAFLAENDAPFGEDPAYAVKGIFGRYAATLHERPFLATYREYVILEGRDLRRWHLNLMPEQKRRLLERIWTVQQAGSYRYYFFARNCATLLVDLLNGALELPTPITVPGVLAAPPASILEQFEAARTAGGEPLARYVPEPIFALEHEARMAADRRHQVEVRLLAAIGAERTVALAASFARTHVADAHVRAQAYRELASLLTATAAAAPADVHRYLRDSALLESHLSTVANLQAQERAFAARRERLRAAVARLGTSFRAAADAELALAATEIIDPDQQRRLTGYRRLVSHIAGLEKTVPAVARQARLLVLLQSEVRYDVARMKAIPGLRDTLLFVDRERPIDEQPYLSDSDGAGQPVTGAEASALLALPLVTRVAEPLRAVQEAKQAVFATHAIEVSDAVLRGEGDVPSADVVAHEHDQALSRSGIDQVAVLAGLLGSASAASASGPAARHLDGGLVLAGALYDERLGDHRRFGFPSHTSFTVARSAVLVAWDGGRQLPRVAAHEARVIGYRALRPSLPEAGGSTLPLGWELWLDTRGNAAQALNVAVSGGWGLMFRLWDRDELTDHLLLTAGASYEAIFPAASAVGVGHPQVLGVPVGLEFRHGLGGRRSHLAARALARAGWIAVGAQAQAAVDVGGVVECHLALRRGADGGGHDPAFVAAFQTMRSTFGLQGAGPATQAMVSIGVALR